METRRPPQIGFLGFGEAAFEISRGLVAQGLTDIRAFDKMQHVNIVGQRAKESGVVLAADVKELAQRSQLIISAVTSAAALDAARSIAPCLTAEHIYVDINTASALTKRDVYEVIRQAGSKFVDAAVMAAVPGNGHQVPMLICGDGADQFRGLMTPYGMNLTLIDGDVGSASTVKTLRSVFMKGIAVLSIESLSAACKAGVYDYVLDSLKTTFEGRSFEELINRWICSTAIHASRRKHEMGEVLTTLNALGANSIMTEATRDALGWIEAENLWEHFGGKVPRNHMDVLELIACSDLARGGKKTFRDCEDVIR